MAASVSVCSHEKSKLSEGPERAVPQTAYLWTFRARMGLTEGVDLMGLCDHWGLGCAFSHAGQWRAWCIWWRWWW